MYNMNYNNSNYNSNFKSNSTSKFVVLDHSLENSIHEQISKCEYQVLREKEIVSKYGNIAYGIDHLIIGSNFIVSIQDKWKNSKQSLNHINHFIKATERIGCIENKYYLGIYLSKMPLTSNAKSAFEYENTKSNVNKFIEINSDTEQKIINKLSSTLYNYKIYFYESDGSTIMLE
jgi:hypothetical protein